MYFGKQITATLVCAWPSVFLLTGARDTETRHIEPGLQTAMEVVVVVLVGNQRAAAVEAADVPGGH